MDPTHDLPPIVHLSQNEEHLQRRELLIAFVAGKASHIRFHQHIVRLDATAPPFIPIPVLPSLAPTDGSEPRVGAPERFVGDPQSCRAFITNCFLLFSLQPRTFATETAKVAYAIMHLTGQARLWGAKEW